MNKFSFESMGSQFEIIVWDSVPEERVLEWQKQIIQMAEEFDRKYSRFIRTSLVWQIAQKPGKAAVDEDFMAMLKIYLKLYPLSDKKFTPLIGFSLADMGYDDRYTLQPKGTIRPTPDLMGVVTVLSDTEIYTSEAVLFDFGGVGKGYFVDKVARFLEAQGAERFLANGSGDMYYSLPAGRQEGEALKVGLEDPRDPQKVIGTLTLKKGALASSGTNKRNWGPYHHIIDPLVLDSPRDLVASWVTAENVVTADALATCLFLCPPEHFGSYTRFEYLLVDKDYKTKKSPGFSGELFV